jgi:hypothetical protein
MRKPIVASPTSWKTGNHVVIDINPRDGSSHQPDTRCAMARGIGGNLNVDAHDVAGLASASGLQPCAVTDFYGASSEVVAFEVVK